MPMDSKHENRGLLKSLKISYYKFVSDRRLYLRIPLRIKVTSKGSGLFEFYSSTNISAGGMFLRAEDPIARGALLSLEFSLPGREGIISAEAKVVRVMPNERDSSPGIGVQFTRISEAERKEITRFVEGAG